MLHEEELIIMMNELEDTEDEAAARKRIKKTQRQELITLGVVLLLMREYEDSRDMISTIFHKEAGGRMDYKGLKTTLERRLISNGITDTLILEGALEPLKDLSKRFRGTLAAMKTETLRLYKAELEAHKGMADTVYTNTAVSKALKRGKPLSKLGVDTDSIMKRRWAGGKNVSERIWANTSKLEKDMKKIIDGYVNEGQRDIARVEEELAERFNVAEFKARRLIRTEVNYMSNQAEIEVMKDEEVEYYRFVAIQDERTSNICNSLAGKVFRVDEAEVGVNLPPLHPNCRSTVIPAYKGKKRYN